MALIHDRLERFSKIRSLLDYPFEQRPRPHQILNSMLMEEQTLSNRLSNTNQAWNLISSNIATVKGQTEYSIPNPVISNESAGKVYFVVRSTGKTELPFIAVPFDDYNALDYGKMQPDINSLIPAATERVSFYRQGGQNQTIKAVIQPTPVEVLTYTVSFYSGTVDRLAALMTKTAPVAEIVDYLDIKAAMAQVVNCEWRKDDEYNRVRRKEIAVSLLYQLGAINQPDTLAGVVHDYIRQINSPQTFDLDHWND